MRQGILPQEILCNRLFIDMRVENVQLNITGGGESCLNKIGFSTRHTYMPGVLE